MSSGFWSQVESALHEAIEASTERECDACVARLWLALIRQARGKPSDRRVLVSDSAAESVSVPAMRSMLRSACRGMAAWYESDFGSAANHFKTLGRIPTESKKPRKRSSAISCRILQASALIWAAAALRRSGQSDAGRRLLRKAQDLLSAQSSLEVPNCRGWLHAEQGRVAFCDDDLETAQAEYDSAHACFVAADNAYAQSEIAGARARLFTHRGRYKAAFEQLALAERWRDGDDPLNRAKTLFYTGRVLRYEQKYKEAVDVLEKALSCTQAIGNGHWEANVCDAIGDVLLMLGDLKGAEFRFRSSAIVNSRDPAMKLRRKYQQAKLGLEQAVRMNEGRARRQLLESVIADCRTLSDMGHFDMLPEKSRMLEGRAHLTLDNHGAAAETLQAAARGFRAHGAWWYAAEAMLLVGRAYMAAGQIAEAAAVFLTGLQATVDEVQRAAFQDFIRRQPEALDVERVCSCIAVLLQQNRQLADAREADQRAQSDLRNLIYRLVSATGTIGPGSFAHTKEALAEFRSKRGEDDGIGKVEADVRNIEKRLDCQRSLARCWEVRPSEPQWLTFAEIIAERGLRVAERQVRRISKQFTLGIFADAQWITTSLNDALDFMKNWAGQVRSTCNYVEEKRQLLLHFRGTRSDLEGLDVDVGGLVDLDSPSPMFLDSCQVEPEWWARLASAAIRCRAIGGRMTLRAGPARKKSQREYCLEVQLPCDEIPLWESKPSP